MDDEQMEQLRRLGGPPAPPAGGTGHVRSLRGAYGDDVFPAETVLVFHRSGHETRIAVKVTDHHWRVSGHRRLRSWDGLLRTVGHGYQISSID